jgi:PPOX class probable F420-dependent enzyme
VPVVFAAAGETVYSVVDAKPKRSPHLQRLENARSEPRVSLLVDHYEEDWNALWWVRADGLAVVQTEGPDRDRGIHLLAGKYPRYAERPPDGPALVIRVTRWRWWSAS